MYAGGLRIRLIKDNLTMALEDGLEQLGWLDPGRGHLPVKVLGDHKDSHEEAQPNIVVISTEFSDPEQVELGSRLTRFDWEFYADVYAESSSIGLHLAGDVRDVISDRFSNVTTGIVGTRLSVLDLDVATPTEAFKVDVGEVRMAHSREYSRSYKAHWWMGSFIISDEYEDDVR